MDITNYFDASLYESNLLLVRFEEAGGDVGVVNGFDEPFMSQ